MPSALYAHLDLLSGTRLLGWCKTSEHKPADLRLVINLEGKDIVSAKPHINRADVFQMHGGDVMCGFDLRLPNLTQDQLKAATFTITHLPDGATAPIDTRAALNKQHSSPSSYQSFAPGKGSSQSEKKLAALGMPNLKGKSFLDIGCNAGFFCKYAADQGATRVVGIEAQKKFADEARQNVPTADILNQRWDKLPNEKFDVIIMLSAMHYEKDQKGFMARIRNMLTPDGVFIFEGGVASSDFPIWKEVSRGVGAVKYPSTSLLQDHIFEGFAYRFIGPSVKQPGDPLARYVYHCSIKHPVWTVFRGKGRAGKTSLVASLGRSGVSTVRIDRMMTDQMLSRIPTGDALFDGYIAKYTPRNIGHWVDGITDPALAKSVARYLVESFPTECDIVVEGYIMTNDLIFKSFVQQAKAKGVRVWAADRA